MSGIPDYPLDETLDFKFTSRAFATGIPTTLAGTPAVEIYEDNSLVQITAGITLTADFDGIGGLNHLRVVATSGNGFGAGQSYQCVISAGTVGGVSVVGEVVQQFSVERSAALANHPVNFTATNIAATGEVEANVVEWNDAAVATPSVAGVPEVDLTHVEGATTIPELAQAKPAATPGIGALWMALYMPIRNKLDVTNTSKEVHNDAGTVVFKKALTDDGTTYNEAEAESGP